MTEHESRIPLHPDPLFGYKVFNRERLQAAYLILSGIPGERIRLQRWLSEISVTGDHACGTIACGAGWLMLHPDMRELGLTSEDEDILRFAHTGYQAPIYYHQGKRYEGMEALGRFFAIEGKPSIPGLAYGAMGRMLFAAKSGSQLDTHLHKNKASVQIIARSFPAPAMHEWDEATRRFAPMTDKAYLLGRMHYAYHYMAR